MTDRFRQTYAKLSPDNAGMIKAIKTAAVDFENLLNTLPYRDEREEALHHLEIAVMFATKYLSTPEFQ